MLEALRRKTKQQGLKSQIKGTFICDADRLPYRDHLFDLVTCIGMLEYYPMEYAETLLNEIKRVLKPDKRCFIDIVNLLTKKPKFVITFTNMI